MPCSTRKKSGTGIQYPTVLNDPRRSFHVPKDSYTQYPAFLDSRVELLNSYPNVLVSMQGGSLYHFYDGLGMTLPGREPATYHVRGGHTT